jgi:hypothetical protein
VSDTSYRNRTAALLKARSEKEKEEELKQMHSKDKEADFLAMVPPLPLPPHPPVLPCPAVRVFDSVPRFTRQRSCLAPAAFQTELLSERITGACRLRCSFALVTLASDCISH